MHRKPIPRTSADRLLALATILFGVAAVLMLVAFFVSGGSPDNVRWITLVMFFLFLAAMGVMRVLQVRHRNNP